VAKPKSPADRLSPKNVLNLVSLDNEVDWERYLDKYLPELDLAIDLHKKLLVGAKNELDNESLKPALRLKAVAGFLAEVSNSKGQMLPQIVKQRLQDLGIPHLSNKKGRPPGRKFDRFYLAYIEEVERIIEQDGIFQKRSQLRARRRRNWTTEFRKLLEHDRWPPADIDSLTNSKTPRSFATHKATQYFKVSYDVAAAAYRRAKTTKR
jgi:hypothetical protein